MDDTESLEGQYIMTATQAFAKFLDSFNHCAELWSQAAENTAITVDPTWQQEYRREITTMRTLGEALQRPVTLPGDFRNIPSLLRPIGGDIVRIADRFAQGDAPRARRRLRALELRWGQVSVEIKRIMRRAGRSGE
jgi:hypothetical protein